MNYRLQVRVKIGQRLGPDPDCGLPISDLWLKAWCCKNILPVFGANLYLSDKLGISCEMRKGGLCYLGRSSSRARVPWGPLDVCLHSLCQRGSPLPPPVAPGLDLQWPPLWPPPPEGSPESPLGAGTPLLGLPLGSLPPRHQRQTCTAVLARQTRWHVGYEQTALGPWR